MANKHHLGILNQGVDVWNEWRRQNPEIRPDLSKAELIGKDLSGADLSNANLDDAQLASVNLTRANLNGADLLGADLAPTPLERGESTLIPTKLNGATLIEARLIGATLVYTQFVGADLTDAQLWDTNAFCANFTDATLVGTEVAEARLHHTRFLNADLTGAHLTESTLIKTNFDAATLANCNVYGISAWDVSLEGATQTNLVITPLSADDTQPIITVDNLEVAQFIYLLVRNEKLRQVIDTITSKVVLILGRFTAERKAVLDALREELRRKDYVPLLFDFPEPRSRDVDETVVTLAHLARFIVADLTEPRSIPHELRGIVPDLAVPVQPLLLEGETGEYGMFASLQKYPWVLDIHRYADKSNLITDLEMKVIAPAEAKAEELRDMRRSQ